MGFGISQRGMKKMISILQWGWANDVVLWCLLYCTLWHIEAETKWLTFSRHFQMHFLEWKCLNCGQNFTSFVAGGPINNIPSLVQIMARCREGDKPLSEPILVSLLTHIFITRPQWVNDQFTKQTVHWSGHQLSPCFTTINKSLSGFIFILSQMFL